MKGNSGSGKLPVLALLSGAAAFVLRKLLYANAVDARGLLVRCHPLEMALAVLTVAVFAVICLAARKYSDQGAGHSANLLAAFGNVAAGAGIVVTALKETIMMGGHLESALRLLGVAAPVCLLLAGVACLLGKKPFFLLHVVASLYYLFHIVTRYRIWSGNPQMQDYLFALLGAVALMLFGFYTAAMEAECGDIRMKLGMGLASLYLCSAELAQASCPALYLGGVVWVLMELLGMKAAPAPEKK